MTLPNQQSRAVSGTTADESHLEHYRRLRMAGRQLISKLHEVARDPSFDLFKAGRKLTIPVRGRTFIFDSPGQMGVLMDFYFHEMRYANRRIVDVLAESNTELTPDEHDLLTAHRVSHCSFFTALSSDPDICQIRLQDLLEPKATEIPLTDISLSQTITCGDLLFMRIVNCQGVHMSGGIFFPFRAVHRLHLLNAYAERMRTVPDKERSLRAYVFFFRRCREIGIDHAYEEEL